MNIQLPYLSHEVHTKSGISRSLLTENKKVPKDLKHLSLIAFSRFPVHLVYSKSFNKYYAAKVFPFEKKQTSASFISETRFFHLVHPHIISMIDSNPEKAYFLEENQHASHLVMDFAPYGSFAELVHKGKFAGNEKLVRAYFQQLIEGLEYLHSKGVAHMDLKLSNVLLGLDYDLKISDFDSAYTNEDLMIIGKGTKNFRAPELLLRDCNNPKAADMYSCGVLLFTMLTGKLPYCESSLMGGYDLYELLISKKNAFWEAQCKIQGKNGFDEDFKELFESLVCTEPTKRATIDQVKESKWYKGPAYSKQELREIMKFIVKCKLVKEEDLNATKKTYNTI